MTRRKLCIALATLALALGACGGGSPADDPLTVESDIDLVLMYCAYGAVSRAQLVGCYEHVKLEQISNEQVDPATGEPVIVQRPIEEQTNASEFAFATVTGHGFGRRPKCLGDAGPFCPYARDNRTAPLSEIAAHADGSNP